MLLALAFYRHHLGADQLPPAQALRMAQLWLRDVTNDELSELLGRWRDAVPRGRPLCRR